MTIVRVVEVIRDVDYEWGEVRQVGNLPMFRMAFSVPVPVSAVDKIAGAIAVTFGPSMSPGKPGRRPNRELNDRLLRQRAAGVTIPELAEETGLTEAAIERRLDRLREKARGPSVPSPMNTAELAEPPAPNDRMYPKSHPPFKLPAARKHADQPQAASEWRNALPGERCKKCNRIKEELHLRSGCCGMCQPAETNRSRLGHAKKDGGRR